MPNINLTEKDMSTFADQQFIQVMYNGNTNSLPKSGSTDLDFTVKFMAENALYQIIYVGENQKVSAPVNVPVKEGYEFKKWLLNGEAFDFSTVITSDITLTAKFEGAEEEVIYEKTLTFAKEGELSTNAIDLETSLESLGFIEGQNYTMKIGDLSLDCVGFGAGSGITIANPDVESQMKWFIMPWTEEGSIFISYFAAAGELFTGDRLVKIVKSAAPTPSEHTFEGELTFAEPEEGSDYYQAFLPNTVILAPKNYIITIDEDASITLIHSYNSEAQAHIYVNENNKVIMASVLVEGQTYSTVGLNKSGYSATVHNIILDEAPAPSETVIIPTSAYETEDTGYGDGYLEFTAIEPAVVDNSVLGAYINEVDAAIDGGTLENIKHTITVGTETLTNQVLKSDARLGITYFGNVSMYDESGEDTGEEWFLGVSSTLAFTTKTPTTINFGLSYKIVQ